MASDRSKRRVYLAGLDSTPGGRSELILMGLAVVTALVVIGVLVAVHGAVPSSGRYITGSGFVFVLGVGLVGLVSLVRARRDGRARARQAEGGTTGGEPRAG